MKVASATGSSKVLRATFIKPKLRNPRNIPAKQKILSRIPENLIERSDFVRFGRVQANMNGFLPTLPRVSRKAGNHRMEEDKSRTHSSIMIGQAILYRAQSPVISS
jgi:hypothetical protein